jgi:hypothetical protein
MPTDEGERLRIQLRQLELVDRIFGLEAQLAEASAFVSPEREEIEAVKRENEGLKQQIAGLTGTPTWRAGRAALAPARAIRRVLGRSSS